MYYIFIIFLYLLRFFHVLNAESSISIEDLKKTFGNNICIEGTAISINNNNNKLYNEPLNTVLESPENISNELKTKESKSFLTLIHELAQYNDIKYYYELQNEQGKSHEKTFVVKLTLGDEYYIGTGKSLKESQRDAASQALDQTEYPFPSIKEKGEKQNLTPTVLLSNFAAQVGLSVEYFLITNQVEAALHPDTPIDKTIKKTYLQKLNESVYNNDSLRYRKDEANNKGPFKVKLLFDNINFIGTDHTVQGARHRAAKKALEHAAMLIKQGNLECLKENSAKCKQAKQNNKSAITQIYEAAQIRKLDATFEIIKESGPPHKKTFVTQCTVGDFTSIGEGTSKKKSKAEAAKNMLENIPNMPKISEQSLVNSFIETKSGKKRNKKNKVIKSNSQKIGMMLNNVLEYGNSLISPKNDINSDNTPKKIKKEFKNRSPQDELLEISNNLNFDIDFEDINGQDDKFYSLLSLHLKPSYICFSEGTTQQNSRDKAAKGAINLIHKFGFLDKLFLENSVPSDEDEPGKVWIPFTLTEETETD